MKDRNAEGYPDPTAARAGRRHIRRTWGQAFVRIRDTEEGKSDEMDHALEL